MGKRLTQEEFIEKCKKIHGDSDILDKAIYNGSYKKVTFICPIHGAYSMTAHKYLTGGRCPKCSGSYTYTKEELIEKANSRHENKYDYSLVESSKIKDKVTITCPIHGNFKQTWKSHINGCGCPKCSGKEKKTTETFISEINKMFPNRYDLSKIKYVNAFTKVCVICPQHGEFWITPHSMLTRKSGCPKCAYEKAKKSKTLSQEEIIKRIREIHGNFYVLSKVEYDGIFKKIELICPEHGSFFIRPHNILSENQGCPKCGYKKASDKLKLTKDAFIEKARKIHGDKYDYSLMNYTDRKTPIKMICHNVDEVTKTEHGEFWQKPSDHLSGCGCPRCSNKFYYSVSEYIEKANIVHNNKYDYSKLPQEFKEYSKNKITIICPTHGEFKVRPYNHIHGSGCPICNESHLEKDVAKVLSENKIEYARQKKFSWLRSSKKQTNNFLSLDFYLPDYNIAIECQGIQHFEENEHFGGVEGLSQVKRRDKEKEELCSKHNIKILYYTNVNINKMPYKLIRNIDALIQEIKKNKVLN